MEVLQNNMVVAILGKGDLVGCDIPHNLTFDSIIKSSSDVKALTYCDLKSIHVPGLLEVLKLYPEFAETFCTEIVHDLTFNLREGYENEIENGMHNAHSLTLPSISEDDENNDEEDDEDDNDNREDGDSDDSGSPPQSPPGGSTNAYNTHGLWDSKSSGEGVPMLHHRRTHVTPRINFMKNIRMTTSMPSADTLDLKDHLKITQNSVTELDNKMSTLTQDVYKLSNELRTTMFVLQKMFNINGETVQKVENNSQLLPTTPSCEVISNSTLQMNHSTNSNNSCQTSSLQLKETRMHIMTANCNGAKHMSKATSSTQTERFLLDDLLCKWANADSGSPPPNSGYSSRYQLIN
jgi:potassium voltage-gated channel Eag-related subfamily H protein 8